MGVMGWDLHELGGHNFGKNNAKDLGSYEQNLLHVCLDMLGTQYMRCSLPGASRGYKLQIQLNSLISTRIYSVINRMLRFLFNENCSMQADAVSLFLCTSFCLA
ncbi:hypothetical protein GUJ93_ZPchr0008g11778 [Zizania palustris]|uniref:Uncharacterized protein n=1 Tax=Zizania palustris TaxID=103762 RepID=A0A8J5QXV0_ZIZPA|nr:hypothetical protein GUJ93_ZPchr0008g11778 [Zizania palustris]